MKTKHTPGPWKFDYDRSIRQDAPGNAGFPITDVVYGRADEDQMANGHLLAAAPDTYQALKDLLALVSINFATINITGVIGSTWLERAKAAIAKAEGRSE